MYTALAKIFTLKYTFIIECDPGRNIKFVVLILVLLFVLWQVIFYQVNPCHTTQIQCVSSNNSKKSRNSKIAPKIVSKTYYSSLLRTNSFIMDGVRRTKMFLKRVRIRIIPKVDDVMLWTNLYSLTCRYIRHKWNRTKYLFVQTNQLMRRAKQNICCVI